MNFISYQERRNKENRLIRRYKVYNFLLFKIKKKVLPVLGENNKIIIGGRELTENDKKILDKAKKITIEGNNNIVELADISGLSCDICIKGDNNRVYIGKNQTKVSKNSLNNKIIIEGNNNIVELADISGLSCDICITEDNNRVYFNNKNKDEAEITRFDNYSKIIITGKNNLVELMRIVNLRCDILIEGDNDKVCFNKKNKSDAEENTFDNYGSIIVKGKDNLIELMSMDNLMCGIFIEGDNNKVCIEKFKMITMRGKKFHSKFTLGMPHGYSNRELFINNPGYLGDCHFSITGDNRKIHIGKECMVSTDVKIWTTDSHPIYDLDTTKCINEQKDIIIGDHVWIGYDVVVNKGSVIPSGCVIGAKSLVNRAFTKENCIIAGTPAKIVKENIYWKPW